MAYLSTFDMHLIQAVALPSSQQGAEWYAPYRGAVPFSQPMLAALFYVMLIVCAGKRTAHGGPV